MRNACRKLFDSLNTNLLVAYLNFSFVHRRYNCAIERLIVFSQLLKILEQLAFMEALR